MVVTLFPKQVGQVSAGIEKDPLKIFLLSILGIILIVPVALVLIISVAGIVLIPLEIGLVDVMGGLQTAVDLAAKMSNLEEYSIKTYPEKDKLTLILESMLGGAKSSLVKEELGEAYIYYQRMKDVRKIKGIQMRMPYYVDIK